MNTKNKASRAPLCRPVLKSDGMAKAQPFSGHQSRIPIYCFFTGYSFLLGTVRGMHATLGANPQLDQKKTSLILCN